jgi:hypothetical protein
MVYQSALTYRRMLPIPERSKSSFSVDIKLLLLLGQSNLPALSGSARNCEYGCRMGRTWLALSGMGGLLPVTFG